MTRTGLKWLCGRGVFGWLLLAAACGRDPNLAPIGERISAPLALNRVPGVAGGELGVVLNSDTNHLYASGSLLFVAPSQEVVSAHPIPRLARALAVSDGQVWVAYDGSLVPGGHSELVGYDVSWNGTGPVAVSERVRWELSSTCSPMQIALSDRSPYVAVSCSTGELFAGRRTGSHLSLVRHPEGSPRPVLVLDEVRNFLYSFSSYIGAQLDKGDLTDSDLKSWNRQQDNWALQPNDVPDSVEGSPYARAQLGRRPSVYQFHMMELDAAANRDATGNLITRPYEETRGEYHWMYFDFSPASEDPPKKKYRLNFASAQRDPMDSSGRSLLLIHRGGGKSPDDGNQWVRMTLREDAVQTGNLSDGSRLTDQLFTFTKVFGFGAPDQELGGPCQVVGRSEISCHNQRRQEDRLSEATVLNVGSKTLLVVQHYRPSNYFKLEHYAVRVYEATGTDPLVFSGMPVAEWSEAKRESSWFGLQTLQVTSDRAVLLSSRFFQEEIGFFRLRVDESGAVTLQ